MIEIYIHDVQDYYVSQQQQTLLSWHIERSLPASLVVIAGYFGEDAPLVTKVREGINLNLFQVINHSYDHVDLTQLTKEEIKDNIQKAQAKIKQVLGVTPTLFIPPYWKYNQDVLDVLEELDLIPKPLEPYTIWYPEWIAGGWVIHPPEVVIAKVHEFYRAYGKVELHVHPTEAFEINTYARIIEASLQGTSPIANIVNLGTGLGVIALVGAMVASLVKTVK